jgi:3-oxoacyl-[acyl-carrier protein] reductase
MSSKTVLDLDGKVALITGAARGIGRETAIRMGLAGARVVVNYFTSAREADEVVLAAGPERSLAVQADVSKADDVRRLIDSTIEKFGRIDIVVNNAATYAENRFDRDSYDAWILGWKRTFWRRRWLTTSTV